MAPMSWVNIARLLYVDLKLPSSSKCLNVQEALMKLAYD